MWQKNINLKRRLKTSYKRLFHYEDKKPTRETPDNQNILLGLDLGHSDDVMRLYVCFKKKKKKVSVLVKGHARSHAHNPGGYHGGQE